MRKSYRLLSALLAVVLMMALGSTAALADESTTTRKTVYKDISANTEIYAVTDSAGGDYPYYGELWEPKGGVLYGRTGHGGTLASGRYGLVNLSEAADESIISHYYSLSDAYSLEYWSYLYGQALADGEHALLVCLNFDNEAADCPLVCSGSYDAKLKEAFRYLATLSCPVFLRIGGEMNVWGAVPAAEDFIAAYVHIANLARELAPNVALVFSPNFSAAVGVDMDSFYPGDEYVDWVGTSLYYNRYANNGDTRWPEFYGVGAYGDAMLNVQQTVNLSRLHDKPVIITEGGSANAVDGADNSEWAAERMDKAYSFLSMVYPEIKAIVSSDYGHSWEKNDYTFYDNSVVTAAIRRAAANNPTLVSDWQDNGKFYTKLSALPATWSGTMKLAAYTYFSERQTATWYVDGKAVHSTDEYPYSYTLDASALSNGSHSVKVSFSNGASKSYSFKVGVATAKPTNDKLYVNGAEQNATVYKIDGSNYFKLRDIAALVNGTAAQFSVGYDDKTACVTVVSGQAYEPLGTELAGSASGSAKEAIVSNNAIYINGQKMSLSVYKIDGNNYFKLRDLGRALNFHVGYDPAVGVTISGDSGYVE